VIGDENDKFGGDNKDRRIHTATTKSVEGGNRL